MSASILVADGWVMLMLAAAWFSVVDSPSALSSDQCLSRNRFTSRGVRDMRSSSLRSTRPGIPKWNRCLEIFDWNRIDPDPTVGRLQKSRKYTDADADHQTRARLHPARRRGRLPRPG